MKLTKNKSTYEIKDHSSGWKEVTKDDELIAVVIDIESCMQVVYQDVRKFGGECEKLSVGDFR